MLTCPCPTDHSNFFRAIHFEVQVLQHQIGAHSVPGRVVDELDFAILRPVGVWSLLFHPSILLFVLTILDDTLDRNCLCLEATQ